MVALLAVKTWIHLWQKGWSVDIPGIGSPHYAIEQPRTYSIGTCRYSSVGASGVSLVQLVDNLLTRIAAFTCRVSKTAAAYSILDIENEVVTRTWRDSHRDRIES